MHHCDQQEKNREGMRKYGEQAAHPFTASSCSWKRQRIVEGSCCLVDTFLLKRTTSCMPWRNYPFHPYHPSAFSVAIRCDMPGLCYCLISKACRVALDSSLLVPPKQLTFPHFFCHFPSPLINCPAGVFSIAFFPAISSTVLRAVLFFLAIF